MAQSGSNGSTTTYLNTTWKSTGQYSQSDAIASGTVGSIPIDSDHAGGIDSNSNNDITIERK